MNQVERINGVAQELHAWYLRHRRELPWRDLRDKDPSLRAYKVLVSEVMLQQTQVPRVMIKYKEFIQTFPSLSGLADANNSEILIAWRGMGYNSRALRLRDAARTIVQKHGGVFPRDLETLRSIKGIGSYTAAAVRNFAFGLPTPLIDTNVRRILHRVFVGPENADGKFATSDQKLLQICEQLLAQWIGLYNNSADLFSSLMDYGSLVQTKRSPKWGECVLSAKGLMKTTKRTYEHAMAKQTRTTRRKEPGRMIAGTFTPNRIVRGRIVEALRDHPQGLSLDGVGRQVAMDWDAHEHRMWLQEIIDKLLREQMVRIQKGRIALH